MTTEIRQADLTSQADAAGLLAVLDSYMRDEMGGAAPLSPEVRQRLIPALMEQPNALVLLAVEAGGVVGIAICFFGLSTFAARPLLNVHDLAVLPRCRGRGVGRALLSAAEAHALERGCVKLTLEVREDNAQARGLYASCGFRDFELAGASYRTLFLAKPLARGRDEVLLRPATLADTERALAVVRRSITESCIADHRNDPAVLERWLANKTPEHFAGWLAEQDSAVIVAEVRGVVRGVGNVTRSGQIRLCYVEPGYQGLGVGAAIVRELERLARGWSLRSLALESSADARSFYERMGYAAAGVPECARAGLSCYPYAKSLG